MTGGRWWYFSDENHIEIGKGTGLGREGEVLWNSGAVSRYAKKLLHVWHELL